MSRRRTWLLSSLVLAVFLLHQDFWNWRKAEPLVFGFLPIGLAYHAAYCVLAALMMLVLVKFAWPADLERMEANGDDGCVRPAGPASNASAASTSPDSVAFSPLTPALSPLRGEGARRTACNIRKATAASETCEPVVVESRGAETDDRWSLTSIASPSPLNGERAGVRGENDPTARTLAKPPMASRLRLRLSSPSNFEQPLRTKPRLGPSASTLQRFNASTHLFVSALRQFARGSAALSQPERPQP